MFYNSDTYGVLKNNLIKESIIRVKGGRMYFISCVNF